MNQGPPDHGAEPAVRPLPFATAPRDVHLRVMHLTDLHAHLYPWDYGSDRPAPGVGLAAAADLVTQARAEAPNTLLFDGGDILQGAPLGDLAAEDAATRRAQGVAPGVHPMIAAMNVMGFDAGTLGNHDLNFGLDLALHAAASAQFPVVLANLHHSGAAHDAADATLLPAWAMLDRSVTDAGGRAHRLRVGVVGFCPPQVVMWDAKHLTGRAEAEDIVSAARRVLSQMRAAGCDLIVVLCHSGISGGAHHDRMENAALQLAALGLADVILTGHQHMILPGPDFAGIDGVDANAGALAGVPAVMTPHHGEGLGLVDLTLSPPADGGHWRVTGSRVQVRRARVDAPVLAGFAEPTAPRILPTAGPGALSRAVLAAGAQAHARTVAAARRPAGHLTGPLHSWFALIADSPAVRLVNLAQRTWARRALAGGPLADLPLLSAAAPFHAGWRAGPEAYFDLRAGPVARRHADMLYPFPNQLKVLEVTGTMLHLWLERSAAVWRRVAPGAVDIPLIDPRFAPYNFDVIDGLAWQVDLTRPARFGPEGDLADRDSGRIRDLTWSGAPVAPDQRFAIAVNGYRAAGGGGFPGLANAPRAAISEITVGDAILSLLRDAQGPVDPAPAHAWRFCPQPGTTALFRSAPDAPEGPAAAQASGGRMIERVGIDDKGFGLFRLHL
ncbi:MAG: 2',3'-cyclic-nucleotide 2'-phosphodiesterase/3'-nucleotidase [Paracoccaceae bacterium]|jgi:2',3'-cyclic-nucleotide 2'-phosphodiesterase/3'-nucleotidase